MRVKRDSWMTVAPFLLLLAAFGWGCKGSSEVAESDKMPPVAPDVVATFADEVLTVSEFEERYAKSVGGWEAAADDSVAAYEDFLNRYVDFRLKVLNAIEAGVAEDSALVAEIEGYRAQLARPYLVEREVTEDIVKDLYERQKLEVTASHLLVRVEDGDTLAARQKMETLRDSVLAGASFSEIAFRNSEDPSAKRNRGYLGTFSAGRMIEAFEDRAYSTPPGEMSEIFRTQYGYHLLYVHDRSDRSPDIGASHILIRVADADTAAALEKIQQVDQALESGESFAEIAAEFSEDPGSAAQGGSLGMFGRGRMVPPFDAAAFAIDSVGGRSDWFMTRFGYHIVQLDSVGELPTYDEAYDDLKSTAQRLPRFRTAERELAREYKDRLGYTIDAAVVDSLTAGYPADSVLHYFVLERGDEESRSIEIATLGSETFTVGDFLDYGMQHREGTTRSLDRAQRDRLIDQMLVDNALEVAATTLEARDPEFADLMKEYRDGIILFRVMEDSVWNRAASDTAGLQAHYERNAASYRFPERMRVVSLFASSDSLLSLVADSWTPGDTTGLAARFADDPKFRIDTTHVADSTNSIYDRALGRAPGETVGPTAYRTGYMLLLVDGVEAPRAKTMEEARADVLAEYQEIVEDAWVARLRDQYDAVLYPENLGSAFSAPAEATDVTTY